MIVQLATDYQKLQVAAQTALSQRRARQKEVVKAQKGKKSTEEDKEDKQESFDKISQVDEILSNLLIYIAIFHLLLIRRFTGSLSTLT